MPQTISLCMIVKNEAELIAQCINSVREIVSEIIVVDTGSDDQTVQVAKSLGAQIFTQVWENDFSIPRNLSLTKASCDWILVLDADEAIAGRDLQLLQSHVSNRQVCWEFNQRHYSDDPRLSDFTPTSGEYPEWEKGHGGYFESACVRLFPNHDGLVYEGRVHELVEHSIWRIKKHAIRRSEVRIQHYGHTAAVRERKNKGAIYTPLGAQKLRDAPENWQAYFELGVEHNNNDRKQESVNQFLRALAMKPDYVPAWVNLGYVLCELGNFRLAEFAQISALELDSKNEEALCNLGVIYMRKNQFRRAEEFLRSAISINPKYVNARLNLARAIAHQGRFSEAALTYKNILEIMPTAKAARQELETLQQYAAHQTGLGRS